MRGPDRKPRKRPARPHGLVYNIVAVRPGVKPCVIDGRDMRKLFYHRVSAKCGSDFERTQEDFEKFLVALGPVPSHIKRPEVGRLDHSMGYVWDTKRNRWNFAWQDKAENRSESAIRRWYRGLME